MDGAMAVVQSLGDVALRGMGVRAGWRRGIIPVAIVAVVFVAACALGADVPTDHVWVSPPALDLVPVQSMETAPFMMSADAVAPRPIVVPLPTGLETGGACLATLAVTRWWTRRRRG